MMFLIINTLCNYTNINTKYTFLSVGGSLFFEYVIFYLLIQYFLNTETKFIIYKNFNLYNRTEKFGNYNRKYNTINIQFTHFIRSY